MKITTAEPLPIVAKAVEKYIKFLSSTYGPAGKKILIAESEFTMKAEDDGYEASESFELADEFENAVIWYMRGASKTANVRAKEGTTTAALIAGAIVRQAAEIVKNPMQADHNFVQDAIAIRQAVEKAVEYVKAQARPVDTKEELYRIAYNSYKDGKLAQLIADTVYAVGRGGVITIEDSDTYHTTATMMQGMEISKGLVSNFFITDMRKKEAVLNDPAILLFDRAITSFVEIVPLLKIAQEVSKNIVVVANNFAPDVIVNFVNNKVQGVLMPALIETPGYGASKSEVLKDIAAVTGAKIIDESTLTIDKVDASVIGRAERVSAGMEKTTIIGGKGSPEAIEVLVSQLTDQMKNSESDFDKDKLKIRIAVLRGGFAVLRVGGKTSNEQKTIKAKITDCLSATQLAYEGGVVDGGGVLMQSIVTGCPMLDEALKEPRKVLEKNGKQFLDDGVIDPADVVISAIESGASTGAGLIELGGISTTKKEEKNV